jgi:chromosome transmission fidelity protein 4
MYQSSDSLGPNADWQKDLLDEEIAEGCAIGSCFVAVATNKGHLRIFSVAGAQLPILSLGKPFVTMAAHENMLVVVYHMGAPFAGCQNLGYTLINMSRRHTLAADQALPLSPGSKLEWIGFSQDGVLSALDSQGVLRQLVSFGRRIPPVLSVFISQQTKSYNFDYQWTPVLSGAAVQEQLTGTNKFWPISVTKEKLRYVPCARSAYNDEISMGPVVLPRPVPGTLQLEAPVLGIDTPGGALEERFACFCHSAPPRHLRQGLMTFLFVFNSAVTFEASSCITICWTGWWKRKVRPPSARTSH